MKMCLIKRFEFCLPLGVPSLFSAFIGSLPPDLSSANRRANVNVILCAGNPRSENVLTFFVSVTML